MIADIPVGTTQKFLPAINLVHIHNSGVAFGFFSGGGALVLVLTLTALAALVIYFLLRPTRPWLWLPTGLLVGGALGNLIDRLAHGYVTDFIKLPAWPAFNLSDMAITVGVLSLLYVLEGAPSKRALVPPPPRTGDRRAAESCPCPRRPPGRGSTASCPSRWARGPGPRR